MKPIQLNILLFIRTAFVFLIPGWLISCQQNEEANASEDSTITAESKDGVMEITTPKREIPLVLEELIEFFQTKSEALSSNFLGQLHVTPEDSPVDGSFYPINWFETHTGYVFAFYCSNGASDLYLHSSCYLDYFDQNGEFLDQVDHGLMDMDFEVGLIQDQTIYIRNSYLEFIEDEEGYTFTATGDTVHDVMYYVTYPIRLPRIDEVDPSEWPFLRNRLYAKHGYIFTNQKYSDYFSDFDWYQPQFDKVDHLLTPAEKEMADFIKRLEEAQQP